MNVGTDVVGGLKHLGIADNSSSDQEARQGATTTLPPSSDQPLFAFVCPVGSIPFFSNPVTIAGKTFDEYQTTDPGLGLLTGQCADLGKFKVPRLSGLASRAPYFHNGSAASLKDVVDFYDTRFQIGLTDEEKQDLIHFLKSL
jgi:cytochrome c peroxidase